MKAGDLVVLTPNPAYFSSAEDYRYVTREGGPAGGTYLIESVNDPTPFRPDLPRSGVTTYTLIDVDRRRVFLAVRKELTYA